MISSREGIGRLHVFVSGLLLTSAKTLIPFLPADLTSCTSLGSHEATEGVDLLNDEALHSFDRIFLFETEVEGLRERRHSPHHLATMHVPLTFSQIGSSVGSCQTAR